jgi:ATP-dependent Clp protease ATP-binding subunit ClpC
MSTEGFGRLSEMSRQIIALARKEAAFFQHEHIRPEHILLAIAAVPEAVATRLLRRQGIDPQRVVKEVVGHLSVGRSPDSRAIGLDQAAWECLRRASTEASQLTSEYIGTEHLLLGILGDPSLVAARVLTSLGVDAEQLRAHASGREETEAKGRGATASPPRPVVDAGARSGAGRTGAGAGADRDRRGKGANDAKSSSTTRSEPLLTQFGRDLTQMARAGRFDPLVGREVQLERLAQILLRRGKNNPVLVGEAGTGKTAIVEGLAQQIAKRAGPDALHGMRLIQLDLPGVVAGTRFRGDFEERLRGVVAEIIAAGDVIVFIDEIHMLMRAGGGASGAMDAASLLKPALARGQIRCIGATTWREYRRYIEADGALARRFQAVPVDEPAPDEVEAILRALRPAYEQFHGVAIGDDAITAATRLSARYLTDRAMPDKAIDLIDEALARVQVARRTPPDALKQLMRLRDQARIERDHAASVREYERASQLGEEERRLSAEVEQTAFGWRAGMVRDVGTITAVEVAEVVASWTGVPVQNLTENARDRFLNIEAGLRARVVGQDAAVTAVGRSLKRNVARLGDPLRPVGSFLFVGPSGVGKTEVARALAVYLFDTEDALIRVDMSELSEAQSVSRLIGAPPGYVGFDQAGDLTERVRRRPYAVVLFDEIDKAHPRVLTALLQVLDSGQLTDGQGRTVNFRNTVILMTANYGTEITRRGQMGFEPGQLASVSAGVLQASSAPAPTSRHRTNLKGDIESEVKRRLLPEFLNRLDGMVIFEPLGRDELVAVARLILGRTAATAKTRGITLTWDDDVADWLGAQAFADTSFSGARPLRQLISKHIEDSIVETTFVGGAGQPHMGRTVHVTVAEGALQVRDSAAVPQAFVEMD